MVFTNGSAAHARDLLFRSPDADGVQPFRDLLDRDAGLTQRVHILRLDREIGFVDECRSREDVHTPPERGFGDERSRCSLLEVCAALVGEIDPCVVDRRGGRERDRFVQAWPDRSFALRRVGGKCEGECEDREIPVPVSSWRTLQPEQETQ